MLEEKIVDVLSIYECCYEHVRYEYSDRLCELRVLHEC
jgi:hypothetical protein